MSLPSPPFNFDAHGHLFSVLYYMSTISKTGQVTKWESRERKFDGFFSPPDPRGENGFSNKHETGRVPSWGANYGCGPYQIISETGTSRSVP